LWILCGRLSLFHSTITLYLFLTFTSLSMPIIACLIALGSLLFSSHVSAQTWSDPTGAPPSNNASTPLNVGATAQAKAGGLSVASFLSTGSMAAAGNLGVGMSAAPDPLGILGSGTYGDAYSKWMSFGRDVSAFPFSLTNHYGLGTVWDSGAVFLGLTNTGAQQKDAVLDWGSNATNPTNLLYKYNGAEIGRLTSGGSLSLSGGLIANTNASASTVLVGANGTRPLIIQNNTSSAYDFGLKFSDSNTLTLVGNNTAGNPTADLVSVTNLGSVGIGTTTPASKLTVAGVIQSTTGGIKFPDGTTQTTASAGGSGSVTGITAGTGLTGGTINTSGTIAADTTYLQRRVSGTCASGNAIQTIASDGTVTCQSTAGSAEADTLNSVTTRGNTTSNGISVGSFLTTGSASITGNLGIGTASPLTALQVGPTTSGNSRIGGGSYSEYWTTESYPRVFLSRDGAASGVSALQFGVGSSPVDTTIQRLPSGPGVALMGGNVGIGTTNPGAKVDVSGAVRATHFAFADTNGWTTYMYSPSNGAIEFKNMAGTTMTLASGSNVGIGTASPAMKLDVEGGGALLGGQIYVSPTNANTLNSGYSAGNDIWINYRGLSDGFTQARHFNVGDGKGSNIAYFDGTNHRIGVNMGQTANYTLDVNGTGNFVNAIGSTGTFNSMVANTISGTSATFGSFTYSASDRKLKTDVKPLTGTLADIQKLQGVSFKWKKDGKDSLGFIAQDVQKVYPQLVGGSASTTYAIQYEGLIAPLVEAVKEVNSKTDSQKNIIEKQQKIIDDQEARIKALEAKIDKLLK